MTAKEQLEAFFRRIEREGKAAASTATDTEAQDALKVASAEIDRMFVFKGTKASPAQSMEWPRKGVDGVGAEEVPKQVIAATMWLTGAYLAGYQIGPANLELSKELAACLFWILDPVIDADASVKPRHEIH